MMKWEYIWYNFNVTAAAIHKRRVKELGQQGWELVSVDQDVLYFKRPIHSDGIDRAMFEQRIREIIEGATDELRAEYDLTQLKEVQKNYIAETLKKYGVE